MNISYDRQKELLIKTLDMVRAEVRKTYPNWAQADEWVFAQAGLTNEELIEIYANTNTEPYCNAYVPTKGATTL